MAVSTLHGGPRPRCPFGPAIRRPPARCQITRVGPSRRLAASGGFNPDHAGASSSTDATAPETAPASLTGNTVLPSSIALHFVSAWGHLCDNASSLAGYLRSREHASHVLDVRAALFQTHSPLAGSESGTTDAGKPSEETSAPLLLHLHTLDLRFPIYKAASRLQSELARPQEQQKHPHVDAFLGHFWLPPILSHLSWRYEAAPTKGRDQAVFVSDKLPFAASAVPALPTMVHVALLWRSALIMQQRAVVTALWHMGQILETAGEAQRKLPPPAEVPGLMHWGALTAVMHAEETFALVLVHTATAASAAAAGVPTAAAAVTDSATAMAAASAMAAPHLPLLRTARRRLLAAALPMIEELRGVQRGCTTHVLLRFLLFSAISPRLRRSLCMRLDVLARRAAQLALLHEHHDAWIAQQQLLASSTTGPSSSWAPHDVSDSGVRAHGSSMQAKSATASAASAMAGSATSLPEPLSARWYRCVFAPEMIACARQLQLEAPGYASDDRTGGDPPGRFDLRDLYRLIRVIEVAVEDLERYGL